MSAAQHTPGPWSTNDWPQANSDISIGAIGTPLIARVPLRDVSINEQKANARLIAAAPDLLAILQSFPGFTDDATVGDKWIEQKNAAIAKALGQISHAHQ